MNKNIDNLVFHKKLSIQLSSDGFSFCVYDSELHQYIHFVDIPFSTPLTHPNLLLKEVKQIFEDNEILHQKYNEVLLIHHNSLNTFVPTAYFNKDYLHQYLQNTVKTFSNDYVNFDELPSVNTCNVYIPFVNVNNFIFDYFGAFTYLHSASTFLENILKLYSVQEQEMFVNVYQNNFQVIVLENNKLMLSNSFNYQTKEDFVYYILFVAEQLKMNPNEFNLTLFGNIQEHDEYYTLLFNYVRNVVVYNKVNTSLSNTISVSPQAHFNLLQLHL